MKLFQYWNANPGPAIEALMEGVRAASPGFDYVRLDERDAGAFIAAEYDARIVAAWNALALPAMQADLLRLLLLHRYGGVYLDATYRLERPLADLVALSGAGAMPMFIAFANTNYLMVRAAGDAFVEACIALILDNIEGRRFANTLMATGPGALNAVRCALHPEERPYILAQIGQIRSWLDYGWEDCVTVADALIAPTDERVAACRAFHRLQITDLERYAVNQPSPHRDSPDHWLRHRGAIYRDPPAGISDLANA